MNWTELLTQFLEEVALMTDVEENQEGQTDQVKLMTVHASKGLEFEVVFVVGLEENIFPLQKAKFENDELEEERRLMYVAITRAKDHLFLSYADSRKQRWQTKYNEPSRFVEELPQELLHLFDLKWGPKMKQIHLEELDEWQRVKHKFFGTGTVLESWKWIVIVEFDRPAWVVRKIESKFLEKIL